MMFILGRKINMSQVWKGNRVFPITVVKAGPCQVTQVKSKDKDGYQAVQIGFENITKKNRIRKSSKGKSFKIVREFKPDGEVFNKGDIISVSSFKEGDKVKVAGVSKGKGFQGVVKKWGFHGRKATHGVKHEQRGLGSVGCRFPQRVIKGKKMPGHMGNKRVTVKNLEIVEVNEEKNLLLIKGAIPGRKGTLLEIKL